MAIYLTDDLVSLLKGKYIVILGDSVQRSIYKDIVALSQANRFLSHKELKDRGEESFLGDKLISRSKLTNGTGYREEREYFDATAKLRIKFYFVTRIYNDHVESILNQFQQKAQPIPNIVIVNSCLWDISRYGRDSMITYRENLQKFCDRVEAIFPRETLVIWRATLPVTNCVKGGFMTADAVWCKDSLRLDVLRANHYACNIVHSYGFNIVDLHNHFTSQTHRQERDGVHWNMHAHRRVTNVILENIAKSWRVPMPEVPWRNDSRIFKEGDVIFNHTNVLHDAFTSCETSQAAEIRYRNQFYRDVYVVPEEAPNGEVYEILLPNPSPPRKVLLSEGPYPDSYHLGVNNHGPVRSTRRNRLPPPWVSRPALRQRMIQERIVEESRFFREQFLTNAHSRYFTEFSATYYDRHLHRY